MPPVKRQALSTTPPYLITRKRAKWAPLSRQCKASSFSKTHTVSSFRIIFLWFPIFEMCFRTPPRGSSDSHPTQPRSLFYSFAVCFFPSNQPASAQWWPGGAFCRGPWLVPGAWCLVVSTWHSSTEGRKKGWVALLCFAFHCIRAA